MNEELTPIEVLKERLKSPIAGAYTLFWSIYNWKVILILFSQELELNSKINRISDYFDSDLYCKTLIPLAFTFAYVLLMPFLRSIYDDFLKNLERKSIIKNYINDMRVQELKQYNSTIFYITATLVQRLEDLKKRSETIVKEVDVIRANNFNTQDINELENSAKYIGNTINQQMDEFKELFHIQVANDDVSKQVKYLKELLDKNEKNRILIKKSI